MNALVLGASGHLGNAIARALHEIGASVTGSSRRPQRAANLVGLGIRYVTGDIDAPGQLEAWIEGQDLVVDAAAPYPLHAFLPADVGDEPHLDHAERRTRALIDAVGRQRARLVYVSSFTTLPRAARGLEALQTGLLRRLHPYFAVKERIESLVLAASEEGLPAVVVNPTTCLGPWDVKPPGQSLVAMLLRQEVGAVAQHMINVVDVRDVARATLAALEAERYGTRIPLRGHNLTTAELVSWVCEAGGVSPPYLRVPASLNIIPAYVAEGVFALFGRPSPSPAIVPLLISEQSWQPLGTVQRQLEVWPMPLSATIRDSVDWYRSLGDLENR